MERRKLDENWLAAQRPLSRKLIADKGVPGLVARLGPRGVRFHIWQQGRNEETGEAQRKLIELGAVTLAQAQAAALELLGKPAEARRDDGATVGDLVASFKRNVLSNQERGHEALGVLETHALSRLSAGQLFRDRPARKVTGRELVLLIERAKVVRVEGKRSVGGPAAARRTAVLLRSLFRHGSDVDLIPAEHAPAERLRPQALGLHSSPRTRYLKEAELEKFFKAINLTGLLDGNAESGQGATSMLAAALLLHTGRRWGELQKAVWANVHLAEAEWHVPAADRKLKKRERASAQTFVCPLDGTSVEILKTLRKLNPTSDRVCPLTRNAVMRAFERLQASGRLELDGHTTIHDLRATWRSWAAALGVSLEVAEAQLGHKSAGRQSGFSGAADVYQRDPLLAPRREAVKLVGAALDRIRLGTSAKVTPIASVGGKR